MSDNRYIEANFIIEKVDGAGWDDGEVEHFLDEFLEFVEDRGLLTGGALGPLLPEDRECGYCEGSGKRDFISDEDRCETCGGSGRKTEEEPKSTLEAEQEWKDIYAPIAQRTEQSPPKGKAEGSNPSRSANVRIGCDRESDREAGDEDLQCDSEGDRERCEDPGRNHSGKA